MIFENNIYIIFLDGFFVGITDDEYECWEIAEKETHGTSKPLIHDDVDRVWWHKINVNRFYYDYNYYTNDKLSDTGIVCSTKIECEKAIKELNKLQLEKERLEAKLRAINL